MGLERVDAVTRSGERVGRSLRYPRHDSDVSHHSLLVGSVSFQHEDLEVYRHALSFVRLSARLARAFPSGYSALADQLRRGAASICLNIAEGAGEVSGPEKARFYRMARRSATECAAVLDIRAVVEVGATPAPGEDGELPAAKALLLRIVPMLVKLAKSVEGKPGGQS